MHRHRTISLSTSRLAAMKTKHLRVRLACAAALEWITLCAALAQNPVQLHGRVLHGHVQDATGRPVPGATISARSSAGDATSTSDATGIVDTDLRLYGLTNTYICSSAVFPSSGFSNPTHTVLALALRLSDHLK